MDKPEAKEALKELLEILVEHPELAERITITIMSMAVSWIKSDQTSHRPCLPHRLLKMLKNSFL